MLLHAVTEALPDLGLSGTPELVGQDFNVTYRVDDPVHGPVAVRCNLDSPRTAAEVAAEVAWVAALAADGVPVARPVSERVATTAIPGLREDAPVVAYHWVDGEDLGAVIDEPDRRTEALAGLRGLGAAMGRLHEHARSFSLPPGTTRPVYDDWWLGTEDHLHDMRGPWATPDVIEVHDAARSAIEDGVGGALDAADDHLLLHADLHPWNARHHTGRPPTVFDFDDSGFAVPVLDLAVSLFYVRDDPEAEAAFLEGLATSGTSGHALAALVGTPLLEALVAGRQLLMLSSVVSSPSGGPADLDVAEYAQRSRRRLAHWLETGRFELLPAT